ncbi:NAD(P)/FAD-dependent oxidoreductase [Comamonas antarctica]|uniref:NAD(P)/FAD-dependent oxidoreductase n=1 Tax=Comamonas antarctica TaxID=2743470 RepID=A0A6N1X113_9BURK|nr:NAD(P)/FAD-dependent oxidoreductase [Comamonas antarctica]QKV51652.1 NAD(P)/FAD-dependent oxidoreductase [Comamonas antarctica]
MTHRIVIVGGGAGGLELATRLGQRLGKRRQAEIILVDSHLTHMWKPLLHEVAAGSLNQSENEFNYIAQAKWKHFQFQIGRMCGLDRKGRTIELEPLLNEDGSQAAPARRLAYDTLVMAIGSVTNDFGTPGAAEHCIFLDAPEQAERFHRQLLAKYLAAHAGSDTEAELRIAIVGAGATGVELAAELRNAAQQLSDYGLGNIAPGNLHITVLDSGKRVLPALPERISRDAHQTLEQLGVQVVTGAAVGRVTAEQLETKDGRVFPASLKVWAAGIKAPDFLQGLDGLETNRINQLVTRTTLQTTLDDDIFVLGDCAACPMDDGSDKNVPPRAQAAHQQASLLAQSLPRRLRGEPLPTYRYRDYGSLVSLSRFSAVGSLMGNLMGTVKVEGWLARMFYISLYRMHQVALCGFFRTGLLMLSDRIGRRTDPRLKLH